jgi:SpoIID/LytB domain protein
MSGAGRHRAAGPRIGRRLTSVVAALVLGTSVLATLVVGSSSAGAATDRAVVPVGGEVPLLGHGYGHGRGLSQYGAYGGASTGASAEQILDFYYAGTTSVPAAPDGIKVRITNANADLVVLPDAGLALADLATGWSGVLPSGPIAWRIVRADGGYGVHFLQPDGHWEAYTFDDAPPRQVSAGPLQFFGPAIVKQVRPADVRGFRGALIGVADGAGLATVNALSMQDYLRGVVPREMPASWPAAALQAQTVAARSYALYKVVRKPDGQYWDICDTTACQVYGGARTWVNGSLTSSEAASTDAAIAATNAVVRQSGGQTINAEFSSSNGGWTADGGTSYTLAREDPWDALKAASGTHSWAASITSAEMRSIAPSIGTLRSMEITARDGRGEWGGRVLKVMLRGVDSAGRATEKEVTGNQVRSAADLRSNWFTFDVPESAIDARYASDPALRATLGTAVSEEQYGDGFSFREYQRGRLYWSAATDVKFVRGDILTAYLAAGGPAVLGAPSTDEGTAGNGGAFNHFAKDASIYWTGGTGAQVVRGAVRSRWLALNAEWGLGFPTAGETAVPGVGGAVQQAFANGDIYWSAGTGAHELRGGLAAAWTAAGGATRLGLPTSGESAVPGGAYTQDFSRGYTLVWSPGGTRLVAGAIRDAWLARDGARGVLGLPTTDEAATPDAGGRFSEFAGGTVVWTSSAGAVVFTGAIGTRWAAAGGVNSTLGLPQNAPKATSDGRGQYVRFAAGGTIFQMTGATKAFLVRGAVGDRWTVLGGVSGLGLPVTDETPLGTGAGVYQVFAKGKIIWSATTGAQPVYGAIGKAYDDLGAEWSRLGLPTRGEYPVPGGTRADFEHGQLSWSSTTGRVTATYF